MTTGNQDNLTKKLKARDREIAALKRELQETRTNQDRITTAINNELSDRNRFLETLLEHIPPIFTGSTKIMFI